MDSEIPDKSIVTYHAKIISTWVTIISVGVLTSIVLSIVGMLFTHNTTTVFTVVMVAKVFVFWSVSQMLYILYRLGTEKGFYDLHDCQNYLSLIYVCAVVYTVVTIMLCVDIAMASFRGNYVYNTAIVADIITTIIFWIAAYKSYCLYCSVYKYNSLYDLSRSSSISDVGKYAGLNPKEQKIYLQKVRNE